MLLKNDQLIMDDEREIHGDSGKLLEMDGVFKTDKKLSNLKFPQIFKEKTNIIF